MEEAKLNPNQKKLIPYIASLVGCLIGLIGLLTPWVSIGGNGLSGSDSTQGKLTYLVLASMLVLGLTTFVERLGKFARLAALICFIVCAEVLVSYAIWLFQALKAINEFNASLSNLDDLGGIFGEALANLTQNIKPSVTTGFYMVLAAAIVGLLAGLVVFFSDSVSSEVTSIQISRVQMIATVVLATLGLVAIVALSGNSGLGSRLKDSSNNASSAETTTKAESSSIFKCVKTENIGNAIKLNQPSFSGDPEPMDVFVATKIKITNNCGKSIVGVKGSVDFKNIVGDTIFIGGFTDDNTILAGESLTTSFDTGWTFNQFEEQHGQLSGLDQDKTSATLVLSKVVFSDGSALTE